MSLEEWETLARDKIQSCPRCNKHFSSASVMRRHLIAVHYKVGSYPCNECPKVFPTQKRLERHLRYKKEGKKARSTSVRDKWTKLECHYCGAMKKSKTHLRDHINSSHFGLKLYECDMCGTSLSTQRGLKRHKELHDKRGMNRPLIRHIEVDEHEIEDFTPDQYRQLVKDKVKDCPKCGKGFSSPRYMRKHLREVHSAIPGRVCDICGRQYKSKSSLFEHKKHYHSLVGKIKKEKTTFECEICGLHHATKYTLRDHMNTHTGTKFTCDECGRGYASLKHLRRHKVKHLKESGELPESMTHKCTQCDKVFTQNHALKKHLDWVHGDKCHVCKVCGAKIKGSLIQHMETHTQEKKFCCHICGKKMRGKLKEHMLIHTGERPYACEFCGSTFKDKWYLRIHMRKHNGERPYNCTECGQSFAARSAFTLHLKKHTVREIECEFCQEKFSSKLRLKEHMRKHFC